jgi:hypothetical protein
MFFGFETKNNNWVSAGRPSDLRLSVTKDATTSKSYKLYFGIFFQSSPRFFWASRTGFFGTHIVALISTEPRTGYTWAYIPDVLKKKSTPKNWNDEDIQFSFGLIFVCPSVHLSKLYRFHRNLVGNFPFGYKYYWTKGRRGCALNSEFGKCRIVGRLRHYNMWKAEVLPDVIS